MITEKVWGLRWRNVGFIEGRVKVHNKYIYLYIIYSRMNLLIIIYTLRKLL